MKPIGNGVRKTLKDGVRRSRRRQRTLRRKRRRTRVGSLFSEATDYDRMKAIYGNNGFWSWLRYWFLDTENYVTFMLLDKDYYDYDYEKPNDRTEAVLTAAKSDDEIAAKLRGMGLNVRSKKKPLTPEELRAEVMAEEKE